MQCPVDSATLLLSERQGVEIDYCPTCRGVWLDRGELDKLISRSDDDDDRDDRRDSDDRGHRPDDDGDRGSDRNRELSGQRPPKKKKKFLSEIFDFE